MATSMESSAKPLTTDDPVFDDIRAFRDSDVERGIAQLIEDKELINYILKFRYPMLSHMFSFILKPLIMRHLRNKYAKFTTIDQIQRVVADYMKHMIAATTNGFEHVGFDKLDKNTGYLFISNHRDISLDPAFIDVALYANNMDTVRIAIGDNLLKIPAASALMRLNKSFIVKRSVQTPREKLKELQKLSAYIGLSIKEGHSVWIAQREGRAKDGDDRTEDAVLKMISLYGRQLKQSFGEYMHSLKIVPVSIAYEYDPNDLAKANELYERENHDGRYQKSQMEDIMTIVRGIRDYKGKVKIVAGEPITASFESAEELAAIIDKFVWSNYEMFPSALVAAGKEEGLPVFEKEKFKHRINSYPEHLRQKIINMYAKPYDNRQKLFASDDLK